MAMHWCAWAFQASGILVISCHLFLPGCKKKKARLVVKLWVLTYHNRLNGPIQNNKMQVSDELMTDWGMNKTSESFSSNLYSVCTRSRAICKSFSGRKREANLAFNRQWTKTIKSNDCQPLDGSAMLTASGSIYEETNARPVTSVNVNVECCNLVQFKCKSRTKTEQLWLFFFFVTFTKADYCVALIKLALSEFVRKLFAERKC